MSHCIGRADRKPIGAAILCASLALGAFGCRGGSLLAVDQPSAAPSPQTLLGRLRPTPDPPPADPAVVQASASDPSVPVESASTPSEATAAATPGPSSTDQPGQGGLRIGMKGWLPNFPSSSADPATAAEFAAAEQLYLKGDLDAAEKAFAKIARKEKKPLARLFSDVVSDGLDRPSGSPWGMKSLYYLGEIKFQKGDFVGAHQKFEELAKEYPGTNYMDRVVRREYEIAQTWLAHAAGTNPDQVLPWRSRFWGGLPVFDTGGHAVAALEQVRLNDPKGPLADDALITIAEYYYKKGDYELAAEYFDQLNTDPDLAKSPLLQKALLGSIDSKLKGYIGPEYDVTGLEQARESALRTMQLFPERQMSTDGNSDLHKTLDLIADQEAERAYSVGSYYRRAGRVISAEYYFGMIVHKWPKSEWAAKAREQLTELAKMPRKQSRPSTIMVRPGSDPFSSAGGGPAGAMGGMGGLGAAPMGGLGPGGP